MRQCLVEILKCRWFVEVIQPSFTQKYCACEGGSPDPVFTRMKRNQNQRELTERTYFIVIVIAQNKNFEIIVTIDIINRLSNKDLKK